MRRRDADDRQQREQPAETLERRMQHRAAGPHDHHPAPAVPRVDQTDDREQRSNTDREMTHAIAARQSARSSKARNTSRGGPSQIGHDRNTATRNTATIAALKVDGRSSQFTIAHHAATANSVETVCARKRVVREAAEEILRRQEQQHDGRRSQTASTGRCGARSGKRTPPSAPRTPRPAGRTCAGRRRRTTCRPSPPAGAPPACSAPSRPSRRRAIGRERGGRCVRCSRRAGDDA